jgi:hypothetical protein
VRRLHRRRPRRWHHREYQSVCELRECPHVLLLTDEDGDDELLLLGELRRHLVGLATVGGLKIVVHHVVYVVADHPAIVYMAEDLTADMRRRRRRWRLGIVLILVVIIVVGGHDGLPVAVPVSIAEVAGALV